MDLENFFERNDFLYHLTDRRNWDIINESKVLRSTVELVNDSTLSEANKRNLLRNRRPLHEEIDIDGTPHFLRDQKPISIKNLEKCVTNGWTASDFIFHLNSRVFFWPNLSRLERHYTRYAEENPIIIRVSSRAMIELNPHAEYCRLNSGATRSSSHWGGAPPPRGEDTFVPADQYTLLPSSVAEVTFPNNCTLPNVISIGDSHNGPWEEVNFEKD